MCPAHCESHYCGLTAPHGGLHETPAKERLSSGERRFGDLHPPGWHRGDDLAADRARRDTRARELSRMSRPRLREFHREQLADAGIRMLIGGPDSMSKDELIRAILRREFPLEDRCDPQGCRWPDGPHSNFCIPGTA
jgi:hypothetical protein